MREQAKRFVRAIYATLCGTHPYLRPWHSQWSAGRILYGPLRARLDRVQGAVLDVGCGTKSYEPWTPGATRYVGLDVVPGPKVDAVITPWEPWPIEPGSFDVVLLHAGLRARDGR